MDLLDLPTYLNDSLFDSNPETLFISKILLCCFIVFATMITLLALKANMMQVFLVEFLVLGMVTALGWLDLTIMVILSLIIAISFSKTVVDVILGGRQ